MIFVEKVFFGDNVVFGEICFFVYDLCFLVKTYFFGEISFCLSLFLIKKKNIFLVKICFMVRRLFCCCCKNVFLIKSII